MTDQTQHRLSIRRGLPALLMLLCMSCHASRDAQNRTPEFAAGEGAITGQLIGADKGAFDLTLAGEDWAGGMKIELLSPSNGVASITFPHKEKSAFVFSHVAPGRYEISVYAVVAGKRTIAGSTPVIVDPGKVTLANVTLTVTQVQN